MWHEGGRRFAEALCPDESEGALHSNVEHGLTRPYNGTKLAVMGCSPHYPLPWERPELLIDFFPMTHPNVHFRGVPAYIEEVQEGFKRGCIDVQCPSQNEWDKPRGNYDILTSTVQLIPGDMEETKADKLQGKGKMDGRWDEVDYEIARQVANGSPSYEKKDSSGKRKAPHCN